MDRQVSRQVNTEITSLRSTTSHGEKLLTQDLTEEEMAAAVKMLKSGKAQGPENITPFVIHCGATIRAWLKEHNWRW